MSGNRLQADFKSLGTCDAAGLAVIWRRHLTDKVPDHLPKSLLYRLLAYRLQVELYGGLSSKAKAYLKKIETELRAGRVPEIPSPETRQMKVGCQLVREHGGVLHLVMVMEGGFAWNGRTFSSLSAVAKAITGTQWNGNRFFGLMDKAKAKGKCIPETPFLPPTGLQPTANAEVSP